MPDKPELFFRRREKGASVFRMETGDGGRMELVQIAVLKPDGEIKPQARREIAEAEIAAIAAWHASRTAAQPARDVARLDHMVGEMNKFTQWIQSDAPDEVITGAAMEVLMTIQDLRTTLVRRLARAQEKKETQDARSNPRTDGKP